MISASHQGRADEDTTQSLSDALNDPNPVTRAWAIGQLGKEFDASTATIKQIEAALEDPSIDVRRAALASLSSLRFQRPPNERLFSTETAMPVPLALDDYGVRSQTRLDEAASDGPLITVPAVNAPAGLAALGKLALRLIGVFAGIAVLWQLLGRLYPRSILGLHTRLRGSIDAERPINVSRWLGLQWAALRPHVLETWLGPRLPLASSLVHSHAWLDDPLHDMAIPLHAGGKPLSVPDLRDALVHGNQPVALIGPEANGISAVAGRVLAELVEPQALPAAAARFLPVIIDGPVDAKDHNALFEAAYREARRLLRFDAALDRAAFKAMLDAGLVVLAADWPPAQPDSGPALHPLMREIRLARSFKGLRARRQQRVTVAPIPADAVQTTISTFLDSDAVRMVNTPRLVSKIAGEAGRLAKGDAVPARLIDALVELEGMTPERAALSPPCQTALAAELVAARNRAAAQEALSGSAAQELAEVIAWASLEPALTPAPVDMAELNKRLGKDGRRLRFFAENRLKLIRKLPSDVAEMKVTMRTPYLAMPLAACHVVRQQGSSLPAWTSFFHELDGRQTAGQPAAAFLAQVRDAIASSGLLVPAMVAGEITKRIGPADAVIGAPTPIASLDAIRKATQQVIRPAPAAATAPQPVLAEAPVQLDEAAAQGLVARGARAVPILVQALKTGDVFSRRAAAHALEALGPVAHKAYHALANALDDEDGVVRSAANQALFAMGRPARFAVGKPKPLAKRRGGHDLRPVHAMKNAAPPVR